MGRNLLCWHCWHVPTSTPGLSTDRPHFCTALCAYRGRWQAAEASEPTRAQPPHTGLKAKPAVWGDLPFQKLARLPHRKTGELYLFL